MLKRDKLTSNFGKRNCYLTPTQIPTSYCSRHSALARQLQEKIDSGPPLKEVWQWHPWYTPYTVRPSIWVIVRCTPPVQSSGKIDIINGAFCNLYSAWVLFVGEERLRWCQSFHLSFVSCINSAFLYFLSPVVVNVSFSPRLSLALQPQSSLSHYVSHVVPVNSLKRNEYIFIPKHP